MKCQYVGSWSSQGCNEDAEPGERFCHAHRLQGRSNEIQNKVMGCGCIGAIILLIVIVVATMGGC